jgi:predicted transcriptional regulator
VVVTHRSVVVNGARFNSGYCNMLVSATAPSTALDQTTAVSDRRGITTAAQDSAQATMFALINGYRISQMLAVVAKLRIADHVNGAPRSVAELARLSDTNEDALYRLLRTVSGFGVFREDQGRVFALTPLAATLLSDADAPLRLDAEVIAEEWSWQAWGGLFDSVRTGRTAFDCVYGQNTWEWFREHASASLLFNDWLQGLSRRVADTLLDAIDVAPSAVVVDVGGGHGALLQAVLRRHNSAQGILFDTPHVIASARLRLEDDIAARVVFVGGDCFERVPAGGDVYLLKDVLHDWTDERAVEILRNCRLAMGRHARLLLIEHVISEPNQSCAGKVLDIHMMVRNGGRNRTEEEFRILLTAADLSLVQIIGTPAAPHVLVVTRQT